MSLFGTSKPTMQELLDIRHFYPEGCDFHWSGSSGSGQVPEISLMMFRDYNSIQEVCMGCTRTECSVRQAQNPNLKR